MMFLWQLLNLDLWMERHAETMKAAPQQPHAASIL